MHQGAVAVAVAHQASVQAGPYGTGSSYAELAAVILTRGFLVVVGAAFSAAVATSYNVTVSLAFAAYVTWRAPKTPGAVIIDFPKDAL